jgi:hypothetical protein
MGANRAERRRGGKRGVFNKENQFSENDGSESAQNADDNGSGEKHTLNADFQPGCRLLKPTPQ